MSLIKSIDVQIKEAMKNKDAERLNVLRLLKSAVNYATIEKHGADAQASDDEVLQVVRKEVKKRQDSIESFEQVGRQDAADKEKAEKEFLETFLPKQLSDDEVSTLVKEAIAETGASSKKEMGAVMKAAMAKADGRADGKRISAAVNQLLG